MNRGYVLEPDRPPPGCVSMSDVPITEIHMVGGVNPKLPYQYYLDLLLAMKRGAAGGPLEGFHDDRDRPDSAHRQKTTG